MTGIIHIQSLDDTGILLWAQFQVIIPFIPFESVIPVSLRS